MNNEINDLWLEEVEGKEALEWAEMQSEKTRETLMQNQLFNEFKQSTLGFLNDKEKIPYGQIVDNYVYNLWQDEKNIQGLLRRTPVENYGADCEWQTVLDLDELSKKENEKWVYHGFSKCPDHSSGLFYLSRGGKDASVTREFNLETLEFVENGFILEEGKNAAEWVNKDQLIIGTDFDDDSRTVSGYPRKLRYWNRGESIDQVKNKENLLEIPQDEMGVWVSRIHHGDFSTIHIHHVHAFYNYSNHILEGEKISTLKVPRESGFNGVFKGQFIIHLNSDWQVGDRLFKKDSVVSSDLENLCGELVADKVHVIHESSKEAIFESSAISKNSIYLGYLCNVLGEVREYDFKESNWTMKKVELPDSGHTQILTSNSDREHVFFSVDNFNFPTKVYSNQNLQTPVFKLSEKFDATGVEVQQHWATSDDGTKVPYFLVGKDLDSGPAPTLQYGYGGFQVSLPPAYSPGLGKLWLERGGRYAFTNIRGGGEFGPDWHQSVLKLKRKKCYEDFAAISEKLIADGITKPEMLGISGGSNGGLLVGAMLTRRPDLYSAVLCDVPLLDMIRYTKLLAGASWAAEYGDPEESDEIKDYLLSYSPYHNVFADKKYPKTFIYTSTKDDRVHPGHARRMAHKMMEQGHPTLYLENTEGGHGRNVDNNKTAEWVAMRYCFLWQELS